MERNRALFKNLKANKVSTFSSNDNYIFLHDLKFFTLSNKQITFLQSIHFFQFHYQIEIFY